MESPSQNCVICKHVCIQFKNHRHRQQSFMQTIRHHQWTVRYHRSTAIRRHQSRHARSPNKFHRHYSQTAHRIRHWTELETICNRMAMCHNHSQWSKSIHHRLHTVQFHRHSIHYPVEICWPSMRWKLKVCHIHRRMAFIRTIIIHISNNNSNRIIITSIIKWYLNIKITAEAHHSTMNMNCNHKSCHEIWNDRQLLISKWNKWRRDALTILDMISNKLT